MADEHDEHIQRIIELSRPGEPIAANASTATVNNPKWFQDGPGGDREPNAERVTLHKQLQQQVLESSPNVEQERKAVVLAGPPGAGKSTVRKDVLGGDDKKYLVIDADDFKAALLKQAQEDGSYETFIKPQAVKDLERETGQRFYPMELASLVHEESSMLAADLRRDSIERGDNIVVDTVLSDEQKARDLGAMLHEAGYDVQVIDVEVPYEVSEERIKGRWLEARQEAEQSSQHVPNGQTEHLGGRWVPSEYARDVFYGADGKTKPELAAHALAESCTSVSRYRVYRSTTEQAQQGAKPTLETDKSRIRSGDKNLVDTSQVQTLNRLRTTQAAARRHTSRGPSQGRGRE